jgi:hypothetical protein
MFMNSEETKNYLHEKTRKLLNFMDDLLQQDDKNALNFHADICKSQLIGLYNDICEYQKQEDDISGLNSIPLSDSDHDDLEEAAQFELSPEPDTEQNMNAEPVISEKEEYEEIEKLPEGFEVTEEINIEFTDEVISHAEQIIPEQEAVIPHETVPEQNRQNDLTNDPAALKTLSEKFKNDSQLLNQRFNAENKENNISNRIQATPITDLKKAIGINDRFSFISELFNGDKSGFESFLDHLSSLNNSSEIHSAMHNTTAENNWASKPSFGRFSELVQRFAMSK